MSRRKTTVKDYEDEWYYDEATRNVPAAQKMEAKISRRKHPKVSQKQTELKLDEKSKKPGNGKPNNNNR